MFPHEDNCLFCNEPIPLSVKLRAESRKIAARFCGPGHRQAWNVRNSRQRAKLAKSRSVTPFEPPREIEGSSGEKRRQIQVFPRAEVGDIGHRGPSDAKAPESPFAKYAGILQLGGAEVDCYVLDTGDRVISQRAVLKAITGLSSGNLSEYLGIQALKPYLDRDSFISDFRDFNIPGIPTKARGLTAEQVLLLCEAYVRALVNKELTTDRQREIAGMCSVLTSACAKVGLIALIDEATGYQYERAEDALQLKLRAMVADELRAWEKTFPDELWEQFGRLTNWRGSLHSRPRWWGHLVLELIYNALDPEIASHLRSTKPPPRKGRNYHQWMTADIGLKALLSHIYEIIGIAKTCSNIYELKNKVALHYGHEPVQITMYIPSFNDVRKARKLKVVKPLTKVVEQPKLLP